MSRSKFSTLDVFSTLLAPVADAVFAETGRTLTLTRPEFIGITRRLVANALRALAGFIEPTTATVEPSAPVQAPVVVPEPVVTEIVTTAEPVVSAPEVAPVQVDPLPFGLTDAEFTKLEAFVPVDEPAPVQAETVEPAPVQPAPKTRKPRKAKLAPVQVEEPAKEPAKTWNVTTIASVHGIPAKTLRNHLANGRLKGTQDGKVWTVTDADLRAYLTGYAGAHAKATARAK